MVSFGGALEVLCPQTLQESVDGPDVHLRSVVQRNDVVEVCFHSIDSFDDYIEDTHKPTVRLSGAHGHPAPFEEPCWRCKRRQQYGVRVHWNLMKRSCEVGGLEDGALAQFFSHFRPHKARQLAEMTDAIQLLIVDRDAKGTELLGNDHDHDGAGIYRGEVLDQARFCPR